MPQLKTGCHFWNPQLKVISLDIKQAVVQKLPKDMYVDHWLFLDL